ncbi:MAG TPA: hypothetical protein VI030_15865 [Propionibacteriaceae bacterium]
MDVMSERHHPRVELRALAPERDAPEHSAAFIGDLAIEGSGVLGVRRGAMWKTMAPIAGSSSSPLWRTSSPNEVRWPGNA